MNASVEAKPTTYTYSAARVGNVIVVTKIAEDDAGVYYRYRQDETYHCVPQFPQEDISILLGVVTTMWCRGRDPHREYCFYCKKFPSHKKARMNELLGHVQNGPLDSEAAKELFELLEAN
jgi:hypothetical protein